MYGWFYTFSYYKIVVNLKKKILQILHDIFVEKVDVGCCFYNDNRSFHENFFLHAVYGINTDIWI